MKRGPLSSPLHKTGGRRNWKKEAYYWNHVLPLPLLSSLQSNQQESASSCSKKLLSCPKHYFSYPAQQYGPGTNISVVFSCIFLGCLRCFSNNVPQRKQGFRSYIALYSLDPAKIHQQCFRVSCSPPVTDMLIILPRSPEILRSTPWRAHPKETQTCRTSEERQQGHWGRHKDTWMGT